MTRSKWTKKPKNKGNKANWRSKETKARRSQTTGISYLPPLPKLKRRIPKRNHRRTMTNRMTYPTRKELKKMTPTKTPPSVIHQRKVKLKRPRS